ncbi:DinB family protein [uncultured Dokdonia sp.]|uniref:DinB family protein n=1 Tax=uncultured Dokdonia sp. TaxID=575653 RepID=UPI0026233FE8|nr:DinB family protein [uncultured Dokdonia sp.]
MRSSVIAAINTNLNNAISLIDAIDTSVYRDTSVGPYYSSIGSHIRHALDFFDCIINGIQENDIDLTARKRDEVISTNPEAAKNHIREIQQQLASFIDVNTDYLLHVTDNLGSGKVTIMYTLESILAQANTHATHHYAIISYMLQTLRVEVVIPGFGYNPSTPVPKREGI